MRAIQLRYHRVHLPLSLYMYIKIYIIIFFYYSAHLSFLCVFVHGEYVYVNACV